MEKGFKIRILIKQLLSKRHIFKIWPQISQIHKNFFILLTFIETFKTNCFYPQHFMAEACKEYTFSFLSVVSRLQIIQW